MTAGRPRVALVASHVVQYMAPLYRALAERVDLQVLFAHAATAAEQADAGFGVPFEWDTPLCDGYAFEQLTNEAARPGLDRFFGTDTPAIAHKLAAGRFDAVIVSGWNLRAYWQAIRAARRAGIPVLVRGDSQLETARGAAQRGAKALIYPRMLGLFAACLAVGVRSRRYYEHYGVPAARIFDAPHCVDNAFFATAADAIGRAAARAALGVPAAADLFLFAGKLIPKKRPLDFLRAIDRLARARPSIHGLVVGDGPLRGELDAHRRRHGTPCTFAGFMNQRQMPSAYAAADALVLPSDAGETWGLVVNEAMAAGTPAIVSDAVGCAPDLILGGETGEAFPCGDVDALAARMERLASRRDREALRARVKAHVDRYSPAAAAAGIARAVAAVAVHGRRLEAQEAHHVDARA
jgi:glycosyltransferase involved in cell wall biosynthesis